MAAAGKCFLAALISWLYSCSYFSACSCPFTLLLSFTILINPINPSIPSLSLFFICFNTSSAISAIFVYLSMAGCLIHLLVILSQSVADSYTTGNLLFDCLSVHLISISAINNANGPLPSLNSISNHLPACVSLFIISQTDSHAHSCTRHDSHLILFNLYLIA